MFTIKKRNYIISLILVFVLGIGACFAAVTVFGVGANTKLSSNEQQTYKRLADMEEYLKENYYTDVTDSAIAEGLYRGMFSSVGDPYTVYYSQAEFQQVTEEAHGENSGIGVVMQGNEDNLIQIINVVEGAPAESAGVKKGDILIAVDGKEFTGDRVSDAAAKARGEAGTKVKVTMLRDKKTLDFEITRANFINPSVSSEVLDDNIGYISVSTFNDNTAQDFKDALEELEKKRVKGLVVDIRNNVGGIVSQGVEIADMLLDESEIAYAQDNKGEKNVYTTVNGKTDLPYVLLINENSASTSEILAVGIKENNGGKLVGTTTYGKGLIQKLEQFKAGDGVRITIMQYFSAAGQPINKVGVKPDYKVEMKDDAKSDLQLKKAVSLLND